MPTRSTPGEGTRIPALQLGSLSMSRSQPLSSRAMLHLAILFWTCDASRSEIKHGVVLAAYAAPLTMHTHTLRS